MYPEGPFYLIRPLCWVSTSGRVSVVREGLGPWWMMSLGVGLWHVVLDVVRFKETLSKLYGPFGIPCELRFPL